MVDPLKTVTDGLIATHGLFVADEDYEAIAWAALAALEAAGYCVVPVQPTKAMIICGSQARDFPPREGKIAARSVWHNMVAAAPKVAL